MVMQARQQNHSMYITCSVGRYIDIISYRLIFLLISKSIDIFFRIRYFDTIHHVI